jgi:hypothetical protein
MPKKKKRELKECKECGRKYEGKECPGCSSREHVLVSPSHKQFYSGRPDGKRRGSL